MILIISRILISTRADFFILKCNVYLHGFLMPSDLLLSVTVNTRKHTHTRTDTSV